MDKMTPSKFAFRLALTYFVLGNIAGYIVATTSLPPDNLFSLIFFPYTFTWGLSALVGTDMMSVIFIIGAFVATYFVFFVLGLFVVKRRKDETESATGYNSGP
jgi:hypothetical protein